MAIKRLTPILYALCYSLSVGAHNLHELDEKQLIKNYALTTCVATYYKHSKVSEDAIAAMQGYREFSNLPLEIFFKVPELLANSDLKGYRSKKGNTIELAYCLDFAESKKVEALYQQAIATQQ
ncbi:hypothetical protein [Vibrio sp. SCSIO 43136]|uniref:hypothetical protein n=1 Tax=Vibrio sp. SCSIO 43136 TaxID=2819101 RepID=UPI002075EC23|nr:hypothetical protein [Vibrio sp. SCSIO 43136]USD64482.1 hypothetical protein J4N39_10240 [Vibrio sp. SCSIO 43136]